MILKKILKIRFFYLNKIFKFFLYKQVIQAYKVTINSTNAMRWCNKWQGSCRI